MVISHVVDRNLKFWNTFFEISLKWAPILRQVYQALDSP